MGSTWNYLDITALGRQEEWEDSPAGLPADAAVQVVEPPRRVRVNGQRDLMTRHLARLADIAYRRRGAHGPGLDRRHGRDHRARLRAGRRVQRRLRHPGLRVEGGRRPHRARVRRLLGPGGLRRSGRIRRASRRPAVERTVDAFLAEATQVDHIAEATPIRVSEDGTIGATTLPLTIPGWEVEKEDGEQLVAAAEQQRGDGLEIKLGGDPIYRAQEAGSPEGLGLLLGAAIVLLIAFGSVVAAGLPLAMALVGLGITSAGLIALLANVVDVPDWTTAVSGLIGIGVGIDYALLVLTRFRVGDGRRQGPPRRRRRGRDHRRAQRDHRRRHGGDRRPRPVPHRPAVHVRRRDLGVARRAGRDARRGHPAARAALPTSAPRWTACISRSSGGNLRAEGNSESPAARWSHIVQRRPWPFAIAATVFLLALAAPALGMRLGFPDAGNDPPDTMTRQAYDLQTEGFGAGQQRPARDRGRAARPGAPRRHRRARRRSCRPTDGVAVRPRPGDQRRRHRGDRDGDPHDLAPGRGDPGAGHRPARGRPARGARRHRRHRARRRCDGRARRPERVRQGPHAALHRRRRRPLVPAPAGRLPLAADLAQGRRS